MQLYLNEFPLGSGLGILEAMAAGCPVVTMYDVHGPEAGRYGGNYFGIDRAIATCQKKEYVELTCRLLSNPIMYQEWSAHAKSQYEKFSDVRTYVKTFEAIVERALQS